MKKFIFSFLCAVFLGLSACGGDDKDNSPDFPQAIEVTPSPTPTLSASPTVSPNPTPSLSPSPAPIITPDNANRVFTNQAITGTGLAGNGETWETVSNAGVEVRTFDQTINGSVIPRRFLLYLPASFDRNETYPLVIILHGANINAEITREFDTDRDLEALADQEGFVLVYANASANALPQPSDDPFFANIGQWVRGPAGLQGDLNYLVRIEQELASLSININPDVRFISGISNGGEMVLIASEQLAPRYRAAFAGIPVPVSLRLTDINTSMLFYYGENDPIFLPNFPNNGNQMAQIANDWALAIGAENGFTDSDFIQLADVVVEGENYLGNAPISLATQNSRLLDATKVALDGQNQVRVIKSPNGGHGIAHPRQFDQGTIDMVTGFRNQDLNSVEEMWLFFEQFID